ncbi:hypothetical protein QTP70_034185 [Hemibagrus guttatus]|uniref:Mitochondrial 2-oxoglutarate/malate carrier protein n=1 Tax=Hemibagrus guttatus TaxID=175788 RepID=A0AAE0PWG1_9TELE|nr:hypothetical protein QTP70_034185 [Hemibagrus guttatus]
MAAASGSANAKSSPKSIKFLFGGLSGMGATVFVQPLDLVKNRMQLSGQGSKAREYKTSLHAVASILRNEGVRGIYTGLSAGLLRQATYTTTRLGIYTILFEKLTKADGTPPNFFMKALIGMTAGATGAFVGTPAEVALIRMTADGRLPLDQRRGYTNVFNALIRITREEGVTTLWRGCIPTMARAVVVNAAQLASYSQSKQALLDTRYFSDGILCHFCASMISGLVTTAASMPVDIAKTRIQNMKMIDGKPEYKNGLDVLVKVVRKEGFFSLWKGFTPYYARLGPHTSKMADLLGSILSSMEKPPTVGDQESRRKAREQAARMKKMQEDEKRKKAEFRKKMEKDVSDFIQDSSLQKKKYAPMGKIERSILHDVAEVAGLTSFSFGEDEESRYVMLFKKEFAPSDEELEAYRRGEEWDHAKAEERRKLKEQAALEEEAASQSQRRPASPSSNYRDKYSHLIGTSAAKDAAHTLEANRAYGCVLIGFLVSDWFSLTLIVPVANKRDTRSIEEAMNDIRAKKRLKRGEEDI